MAVCEQISDQQMTAADQNAAALAQKAANTAAGIQVHKHAAVAGPGSFTAHTVYYPPVKTTVTTVTTVKKVKGK